MLSRKTTPGRGTPPFYNSKGGPWRFWRSKKFFFLFSFISVQNVSDVVQKCLMSVFRGSYMGLRVGGRGKFTVAPEEGCCLGQKMPKMRGSVEQTAPHNPSGGVAIILDLHSMGDRNYELNVPEAHFTFTFSLSQPIRWVWNSCDQTGSTRKASKPLKTVE